MSTVEVKLFRRKDNTGFVRVRLRSAMKPGFISYKDLELDEFNSKERMRRACGLAGGALAEYQGEQYGDNHNHSECAQLAYEAFAEMWEELEKQG